MLRMKARVVERKTAKKEKGPAEKAPLQPKPCFLASQVHTYVLYSSKTVL